MAEENRATAETADFVAKAISVAGYTPSPEELARLEQLYPMIRDMVARLRALPGVEEDAPALVLDLSGAPAREHRHREA